MIKKEVQLIFCIAFTFCILAINVQARENKQEQEQKQRQIQWKRQNEILYLYRSSRLNNHFLKDANKVISRSNINSFVNILWEAEDEHQYREVELNLRNITTNEMSAAHTLEKLEIAILLFKHNLSYNFIVQDIMQDLSSSINPSKRNKKLAIFILSNKNTLSQILEAIYIKQYLNNFVPLKNTFDNIQKNNSIVSKEELFDLFNKTPIYKDGVKLFLFCRSNRKFPCLFLMRDKQGNVVYNKDGEIWSQPALAFSRYNKIFSQSRGNTPTGLFIINSVIPYANRKRDFGKYRRLIIEDIRNWFTQDTIQHFLPESSWDKSWWKEVFIAYDFGRSDLRIHGTGKINPDKSSSFYPFVPTSGCIAQKENNYDGKTYNGQEKLLKMLMKSMGIAPTYKHQEQIRSLLYVVNIDDKEAPVTKEDLEDIF